MNIINESIAREIYEFMFFKSEILLADSTIVLGNSLWLRPLLHAINIYESGRSGKVIFCGGFNRKIGCCEADAMKKEWVRLRLPSEGVMIDRTSRNTHENLFNAKYILQEVGLYSASMSINVVAINFHMRRAIETAKIVFSENVKIGVSTYPSMYCNKLDWHKNPEGQKLVIGELLKIKRYLPLVQIPESISRWLENTVVPL